MLKLAIKGHATRGKEVIQLLEMLGGKNIQKHCGDYTSAYYYIDDSCSWIRCETRIKQQNYTIFLLEEFENKFPYKVGDKVMFDCWECVVTGMEWCEVWEKAIYIIKGIDVNRCVYAKDLQPYKEEAMENEFNLLHQLKDYFDNTPREVVEKEWHEYDKYNEISPKVNEYLEYVNNIRKPKCPKTFIEVLNFWHPDRQLEDDYQRCYKKDLVEKLQDLLYARDAYWKIAEDWKPNWKDGSQRKHCIVCSEDNIHRWVQNTTQKILAFPTEEMRDAFYENFKERINEVKELL